MISQKIAKLARRVARLQNKDFVYSPSHLVNAKTGAIVNNSHTLRGTYRNLKRILKGKRQLITNNVG